MDTKLWYKSQTIQGGVIQLLVFLDLIFDLKIGGDTINGFIVGIFGLIGTAMVIIGRLKAKTNLGFTEKTNFPKRRLGRFAGKID